MGSEPFPDENEYDAFLSAHGGSANAYTEMVSMLHHRFWLHCCTGPLHLGGSLMALVHFAVG